MSDTDLDKKVEAIARRLSALEQITKEYGDAIGALEAQLAILCSPRLVELLAYVDGQESISEILRQPPSNRTPATAGITIIPKEGAKQ